MLALVFLALAPVAQGQSVDSGNRNEGAAAVRPPRSISASTKPLVAAGTLVVPASSQFTADDAGRRAHTNIRFSKMALAKPLAAPPYNNYGYETPQSVACIYQLTTPVAGCNPNSSRLGTPAGGGGTIAIVDAYDDPNAYGDLAYFSEQFGLAFSPQQFHVVYASGAQPPVDATGGWEMEEALDIEYAHAMAPNATLYLVEAASNANADLFQAVTVAANLVECGQTTACGKVTGAGEVSMSWGEQEFALEAGLDGYFNRSNVVFLAAAGDAAGVLYPSASPNVVSVGGTSTARSLATGNLIGEIAWSDGGGGLSTYEPIPAWQAAIPAVAGQAGRYRAVPDVAAVANPYTGVWIYDSFPYEGVYYDDAWWTIGGTSAATPIMAGAINAAAAAGKHFASSSAVELSAMYAAMASSTSYAADFNDIAYGACGYYSNAFSATGYDLCTGIGSPRGLSGK